MMNTSKSNPRNSDSRRADKLHDLPEKRGENCKGLSLQFFGGSGEEPDLLPEAGGEKRFSQSDLDRVISERLSDQRRRLGKEWEEKLREAKAEGERMARLSVEERAQEERRQCLAELEERERSVSRKERRMKAVEMLNERGLPGELADILDYESDTGVEHSLERIETAFRQAVRVGVESRLRGTAPPAGSFSSPVDLRLKKALGIQ